MQRLQGVYRERLFSAIGLPSSSEGCMLWSRGTDSRGYGAINVAGKIVKAHRAIAAEFHGEFDDHLHVLHTCDNTTCVRPDHLYTGTHADNMRDMNTRGRNAMSKKTHCFHGHELSGANLYRPPRGGRSCRACKRIRWSNAKA